MDKNRQEISRTYYKRIWTTKDGQDIPVKKMSDSHLQNAYNMMFNRGITRDVHMEFGWLEDEMRSRKLPLNKLNSFMRSRRKDVRFAAEEWAKVCFESLDD